MTLFKLKNANCVLIEDDYNKNIIPLISELVENNSGRKYVLKILCLEHPASVWENIFTGNELEFYEDSRLLLSSDKSIYVIDSLNQMILDIGWSECLKCLKTLLSNTDLVKLILIMHRDCPINSKIQMQLNHLANAIVSYDENKSNKVRIEIKKGGKYFKSEKILLYDTLNCSLKLTPVVKDVLKVEEPDKVLPNELSTFKIEIDQIQQLQKNKLKLPYMSKINEGQSKVYYEPDAVDDWDDEDPDDDLDI